MKKTVITVIVTFVLTTLFWVAIGYLTKVNTTNDYSQDIIGKWEPIEVAEHHLEFSKYGTMIQTINLNKAMNNIMPQINGMDYEFDKEYPYIIEDNIVSITQNADNGYNEDDKIIDFQVAITSDESGTYLEIYGGTNLYDDFYGVTKLSGKYKKVD